MSRITEIFSLKIAFPMDALSIFTGFMFFRGGFSGENSGGLSW
ncbi:hypothetical protein [Faecalispora sporosphaeroides]|nr:hypothetical protein [Faecalispora sporosphaeroides]